MIPDERTIDHYRLAADTPYVLRGEYSPGAILEGLTGLRTPIFDRLAAERFGA